MTSIITLSNSAFLLCFHYANYYYAVYRFAEPPCAALSHFIMLCIVTLSIVMLSVIAQNVMAPLPHDLHSELSNLEIIQKEKFITKSTHPFCKLGRLRIPKKKFTSMKRPG